jgi:hypothetical protein
MAISGGKMDRESDEKISIFVRDEETGRLVFNESALQALGLNPAHVQQRGYPVGKPAALTDADANKIEQAA